MARMLVRHQALSAHLGLSFGATLSLDFAPPGSHFPARVDLTPHLLPKAFSSTLALRLAVREGFLKELLAQLLARGPQARGVPDRRATLRPWGMGETD